MFLLKNGDYAEAQQNPPPAVLKVLNKMAPPLIGNIVSSYHEGQIWLFYEKMTFFPESFREEDDTVEPVWPGVTFYTVWNGTKWSKEKKFDRKVYDAVSDGKRMIIFVDGGYQIYEGTYWSDIKKIEGMTNPFACLSPEGIYIFYNKDNDLVFRILQDQTLTGEHLAKANWEFHKGEAFSFFLPQNHSRAVYAFDQIWLYYTKQLKDGISPLFYQTFTDNQWSKERLLTNVMQYSPVVKDRELYIFYVNWLPSDPQTMSMSASFKSMMRTNYRIYNGSSWSKPHNIQTGQTLLANSLAVEKDLWLFVGAMTSISHLKLSDGNWSKMKSIGDTSPEMIFALTRFAMNFVFFILSIIIVWLVSNGIEKKKKVILDLGQKQYEAASLLRRYIAHAIDAVIWYLLWMVGGRSMISPEGNVLFDNFFVMFRVMFFGYFMGVLLYFVLLEGMWGRTIGKLAARI